MIGRTAGLSLRLLRLGGRRAWFSAGLVGAGVAVGAMLLAVAIGALNGWDARESRIGWRSGAAEGSTAAPVASVRVIDDRVAGQPMQIVDLVDPRPGVAPPPGLARVPAPGEVFLSPALAALRAQLPPDQLAQRLPAPVGIIEPAGLRDPGELVAVVGRSGPVAGATPVEGFDRAGGIGPIEIYRQLTFVAVALLVVPVVSMLGASARLTAARRGERLATLRLLGASTRQVTVVSVTEVTVVATLAAAVGVGAQWLLAPALATIELAGSGWYAADLRPAPLVGAAVVAGVGVLAMIAAVGGMRQVIVSPLGVARRARPGGAGLVRLLGLVAGIAVFAGANIAMRSGPAAFGGIFFGLGVLALFGTVSLIGPLVVRLVGAGMTRTARSVPLLLAGRRLLDDPKGAFRPLAGLAMAVFVAGFLAPLTATATAALDLDDSRLYLRTRDVPAVTIAQEATQRLDAIGIAATVTAEEDRIALVPPPGVERDRVRTALAPLVDGRAVLTEREQDEYGVVLLGDLLRGALIVLVGTFLVAATATGTTAAARVLDQRRRLRLLRLAGTPLAVFDAARRAETVRPLLVVGGIALALGLLCASPFVAATYALAPSGLILLGSVLVGGIVLVLLASAASRPLLCSVATGPARDD
ncbi:FtsX-like permease family protein [Pseudonocardia sp. TRM90224]|uniref:FtsX-like permease family protein n=1 Tax=Pseudonocardia sp. TRM90224 TaxID=2812678 RepID=UPI001E3411E6|nr:FtsX-like permease family protein [Pseudonocardia sp. TRM90224]